MAKEYLSETYRKCPIIFAMEIIGSKWKFPILWNLTREKTLHYNEIRQRVTGITNTMLTRALRALERDGLVLLYSAGTVPPSVTYTLSSAGQELLPALNSLYAWGEKYQKIKQMRKAGTAEKN